MEIEDLKDIWRMQSTAFQHKDEAELASMLRGKSTSIVARLKRNVWIELIFTFLGGLGLLAYAMTLPDGSLKSTSISILLLFSIYSIYYFKKLRLLHQFDHSNDHIKANLERLIHSLNGYLRFYKRSYAILYPVYFILGLLFTAIEQGASGFISKISKPEVFVTLLAGAILFFICSTWLTSWYLKKLYGDHLKKLEAILGELQASH